MKKHCRTSPAPLSPSDAPAPSAAAALLCVASLPSHSRWGTWGRTHQPMGSGHRRRRTRLVWHPDRAQTHRGQPLVIHRPHSQETTVDAHRRRPRSKHKCFHIVTHTHTHTVCTDFESGGGVRRRVCDLSVVTGASSFQINNRSQDGGLLGPLGLKQGQHQEQQLWTKRRGEPRGLATSVSLTYEATRGRLHEYRP